MKMNGKKLALFLPALYAGGAERVMLNLAKGFSEKGIKVDLVLAKAEGPFIHHIPKGVRIVDLKAKRTLYSLPSLVQYIRAEKPKALLSTMYHANIIAIWAKIIARVPLRLAIREAITTSFSIRFEQSVRGRWIIPILIRKFYKYADVIIAISQGVAQDLKKFAELPQERIQVIYNPIDLSKALSLADEYIDHPWFRSNHYVILGVGRLDPQKDFDNLIRAFALVKRSYPAKLMILGEGKERPKLERLIKDLGLEEDVSLPGFVDNPYKYIRRSSVFVLSSKYEGFPNVLVEAMALGTPVVSTDCPSGPAEILENGKWGKLVPVGDPKALADAINQTLEHNNLDRKLLQERAKEFSLEHIIPIYLEVLGYV